MSRYETVEDVLTAIRRAGERVSPPRGPAAGWFDTGDVAAARHGRIVSITRDGRTQAFNLRSTGMARFLFQRLTQVTLL